MGSFVSVHFLFNQKRHMENWIGVGIWIIGGGVIGLAMKAVVKIPVEETPGHSVIIFVLGAFGASIGGMLGIGLFEFFHPLSLSMGSMGGALVFSVFMTGVYRWAIGSLT